MRSIGLVVVLTLSLALALAVEAQPARKIWRIGIPSFGSAPSPPKQGAFTETLRDLGYVEGRNLAVEWRCCARGNIDRLNELTLELTRLPVDILVVVGPQAARAAKAATRTMPIVFVGVADPIATGLVESLAHPGGNITGVTHLVSGGVSGGFAGKTLQLLKEAVPTASRFAILINPTNPVYQTFNISDWASELARNLRDEVRVVEARERNELGPAFDQMRRDRRDGLLVAGDLLFSTERQFIADLAARHRIPAIYFSREHVDAGGFMSYSTSLPDLGRKAARYVDKILKGAKPGDLPVEQPTKFELVINLKTAKALGLTIPQSILVRADEVIQ